MKNNNKEKRENDKQDKYMGSVKVGAKGQIVIPKEVREMFNIEPGDTLLLLADVERGIAIQRLDYFDKMPDEINRASWVAKERQRILNEAQSEADDLIEKAKEQQKILIEESEITRQAKDYANQLIQEAEQRASEMKTGAYNYSDEILSKLQDKIKEINNIIEDNREELKNM
jgi:AbrB family looped-hinge helix DNA binding protein